MEAFVHFISSLSQQKRIELEMMSAILSDKATYPWNPADPITTDYFDHLEDSCEPLIPQGQEIEPGWHYLARQAEQLWARC